MDLKMSKKICYFDNLKNIKVNSNGYWLGAFELYGEVVAFDITRMRSRIFSWIEKMKIKKEMRDFSPDHIHFGGSAKNNKKMPVSFVKWVRAEFPKAKITYFFGDGYNNDAYFKQVEAYADAFFMTNTSFLKNRKYRYMICPVPACMEREWVDDKETDLVFIGNNYNKARLKGISELRKKFNIRVFGSGWPEEFGAYYVYYDGEYADVCAKARIVMADPAGPVCMHSADTYCVKNMPGYQKGCCRYRECPNFSEMVAYLSNRTANTMLACAVHLVPYIKDIEKYFDNWQDIVWYHNDGERDGIIRHLLDNPDKCKVISLSAREKARNFIFEKAAETVLNA
jgi:hypothetical protein